MLRIKVLGSDELGSYELCVLFAFGGEGTNLASFGIKLLKGNTSCFVFCFCFCFALAKLELIVVWISAEIVKTNLTPSGSQFESFHVLLIPASIFCVLNCKFYRIFHFVLRLVLSEKMN